MESDRTWHLGWASWHFPEYVHPIPYEHSLSCGKELFLIDLIESRTDIRIEMEKFLVEHDFGVCLHPVLTETIFHPDNWRYDSSRTVIELKTNHADLAYWDRRFELSGPGVERPPSTTESFFLKKGPDDIFEQAVLQLLSRLPQLETYVTDARFEIPFHSNPFRTGNPSTECRATLEALCTAELLPTGPAVSTQYFCAFKEGLFQAVEMSLDDLLETLRTHNDLDAVSGFVPVDPEKTWRRRYPA